MRYIGLAAAILGGLCGSAGAQEGPPAPTKKPAQRLFGPEFGVWRPTDPTVQRLFGETWQNIGVGLGPVRVPDKRGIWMPDFQLIVATKEDRRLTLAPVGFTWRRALSGGESRGYIGLTPQAVFVRTEGPDLPTAWRVAPSLSLVVGQGFGDRFYIEGGYSALGRVRNLDFSGWNLAAGFRF